MVCIYDILDNQLSKRDLKESIYRRVICNVLMNFFHTDLFFHMFFCIENVTEFIRLFLATVRINGFIACNVDAQIVNGK